MKGMPGIVIAAALGIIGAFCNWFYIANEARNYEKVEFLAIRQDANINVGDKFRKEHFVSVGVPRDFVGQLEKIAVRAGDIDAVTAYRATRSYRDNEILLQSDLTGIAQQRLGERLGKNEVEFVVVVDPATFISQHYNPGDEVEFFIPQLQEPAAGSSSPSENGGVVKTVGRFRILALGNRMGSWDIAAAHNQRPVRENIVTIALEYPFNAKAQELFRLISAGGGRGVRMIKHKPAQ